MLCWYCKTKMQEHQVHEIAYLHFCEKCHAVFLSDEVGVEEYVPWEFKKWKDMNKELEDTK